MRSPPAHARNTGSAARKAIVRNPSVRESVPLSSWQSATPRGKEVGGGFPKAIMLAVDVPREQLRDICPATGPFPVSIVHVTANRYNTYGEECG